MLTHLSIKNLAVVEQLELEFQAGMTVFTGETGAGKSILIDALGLTLGMRGESSLVRPGCDSAEIIAVYDIQKLNEVRTWLGEQDLKEETHRNDNEEQECIVRRIITVDGRSRCFINGRTVPVNQLKELGELLINLHGQHQHQSLLKPDYQRLLLDNYGDHLHLTQELRKIYHDLQKLIKSQKELQNLQGQQDKLALLNYQIQELEELNLAPNETIELEQEHRALTHAGEWLMNCETALSLLKNEGNASIETSSNYGGNHGGSQGAALNSLHQALHVLSTLKRETPSLNSCHELLSSALINLEEAINELTCFKDNIQMDPERLHQVEQRLNQIHQLARKHRVTPEQLMDHYQQLMNEAQTLSKTEALSNEVSGKIKAAEARYHKMAQQLSQARGQTALQLTSLIVKKMHELDMPKGQFEIQILAKKQNISPDGMDDIEFLVTTNPGLPKQSLRKIASGGELSRISLAIQVITAMKLTTPSLIFDEVDVGISGKTADTVGQLLRQLGQETQVLCVTHLPQVAAKGHHHYKVEKRQKAESTSSTITVLNGQDKIQEIARMLGGSKITHNTLASAEEMLQLEG